jgi:hypothetical protein
LYFFDKSPTSYPTINLYLFKNRMIKHEFNPFYLNN